MSPFPVPSQVSVVELGQEASEPTPSSRHPAHHLLTTTGAAANLALRSLTSWAGAHHTTTAMPAIRAARIIPDEPRALRSSDEMDALHDPLLIRRRGLGQSDSVDPQLL